MTEAIPKELLKKIKRLEIDTRKIVQSTFSGSYLSAFKGQGMDFSDIRAYQIGDDVRKINWNVSARSSDTHINLYQEERELTILLAVDISASNEFGSLEKSKREIAAEVSAILGFSAIQNNDKVGLILFSDQVEAYVPPKKVFFFSSRRRHTMFSRDWSSDVCSSDLCSGISAGRLARCLLAS